MDAIDRQIVRLLHSDGRLSNVEIGRELGLSEGAIRRRLERLLSSGDLCIRGIVEPQKVGLTTRALIFLKVELPHLERISQLLHEMPEILSVKWITGEYDLMIEAAFEDDAHLVSFLNDRLSRIPGIVSTQTSHVLHIEKEWHEWAPPPPPKPTILIVDDDPDFLETTRIVLEKEGFATQIARNGSEALQSIIANPPSLVILDIMMDGIMDGWDASWRIRSNPNVRRIPILVVSSITSTDYLSMFPTDEDNLIDNFISKPVSPTKLVSEVRRLLERTGRNGRSP